MESSVESWKGQERIDWGKTHTKTVRKDEHSRNVRAVPYPCGETRVSQFALIMGWWDPIQPFRVIEVKQLPKRYLRVISVCTGPALMGVFLRFTPAGRNLRNATLWDMGTLVQCWPNDTSTPTKMCTSFYAFRNSLHMFVLTCDSLYMCSFLSGCFFSFSSHPLVSSPPPLLKSLPTHPLSTCTCTHACTHTPYPCCIWLLSADFCRTITCIMLDFVKTSEHLLIPLLIQNQLRNKTVVKQMEIKI